MLRFSGSAALKGRRQLLFDKIRWISPRRNVSTEQKPGSTGRAEGKKESVFGRFAGGVREGQQPRKEDSGESLKADVRLFEEKFTELKENETVRRAKELLGKARDDVLRQNEAIVADLREKAQTVRGAVGNVAGKVGAAVDVVSQPVRDLGEKIRPYVPDVMESEVVKRVSKTAAETEERLLEDSTIYQYGGFKSKEQRDRSKWAPSSTDLAENEINMTANSTTATVEANPEAGDAIVLHKESKWATIWNNFVDNNRLLQRVFGMKRSYEESNNVFVYFAREISNSIADRLSSLFAETEVAQAMREIHRRDPSFSLDSFLKYASHHLIPEILDALLVGDLITLRRWSSEPMYRVLQANFETQLRAHHPGHRLEGRILDMRGLELVTAKVVEGEMPVVVLTFHTQQVAWVRGATGEIVEGSKDKIENVLYVMALAKEEAATSSTSASTTGGWKLVELAMRDRSGAW